MRSVPTSRSKSGVAAPLEDPFQEELDVRDFRALVVSRESPELEGSPWPYSVYPLWEFGTYGLAWPEISRLLDLRRLIDKLLASSASVDEDEDELPF